MYLTSDENRAKPLETKTGEIIYELTGAAAAPGLDTNHSLARIIIPPGKSSSLHYHKQSQETYYILEGEGAMQIGERQFRLHPGQACLIEAGEVHQIKNMRESDLVFIAICAPAWVAEDSFEVG